MIHAAGTGTVLTLLGLPESERDPGLADATFDALVAAITTGPAVSAAGAAPAANALRAQLDGLAVLTDGERRLLDEWLARVASSPRA